MTEVLTTTRWYLELDGITEGVFKEASGFEARIESIEYRAAGKGGQSILQKIPGSVSWANIVLRRGLSGDAALWDWWQLVEQIGAEGNRKNGTLTCYSAENQAVVRYSFRRGWICRYKGPTMDASKNEIAIEEIEICHEGLERQS